MQPYLSNFEISTRSVLFVISSITPSSSGGNVFMSSENWLSLLDVASWDLLWKLVVMASLYPSLYFSGMASKFFFKSSLDPIFCLRIFGWYKLLRGVSVSLKILLKDGSIRNPYSLSFFSNFSEVNTISSRDAVPSSRLFFSFNSVLLVLDEIWKIFFRMCFSKSSAWPVNVLIVKGFAIFLKGTLSLKDSQLKQSNVFRLFIVSVNVTLLWYPFLLKFWKNVAVSVSLRFLSVIFRLCTCLLILPFCACWIVEELSLQFESIELFYRSSAVAPQFCSLLWAVEAFRFVEEEILLKFYRTTKIEARSSNWLFNYFYIYRAAGLTRNQSMFVVLRWNRVIILATINCEIHTNDSSNCRSINFNNFQARYRAIYRYKLPGELKLNTKTNNPFA